MMKKRRRASKPSRTEDQATLPTFMDHVRELQGRLFSIALVFLVVSAAAYPFFEQIASVLTAPLGAEHELVYLTPGGAFTFILKVCMYVGLIGALPFIMYHLYHFLLPAVKATDIRRAFGYTFMSLVLAAIGLLFAYHISLPAALYFLTSFNIHNINPMLTIDSYFSFIMTYMLAGALLFQVPLIVLIINYIKPLTPRKMMNYQRHLIAGSFITAAVISPTPDALNQALLACPMVLMYQVSIVLVWWKNRKRTAAVKNSRRVQLVHDEVKITMVPQHVVSAPPVLHPKESTPNIQRPLPNLARARSTDGFIEARRPSASTASRSRNASMLRTVERARTISSARRAPLGQSIDGFLIPNR